MSVEELKGKQKQTSFLRPPLEREGEFLGFLRANQKLKRMTSSR